jgi:hypothetical protein
MATLCLFFCACSSQKKCACPIRQGEIVFFTANGAETAKPIRFVNIRGGHDLFSSARGVVKKVSLNGTKIHLTVQYGDLIFGYDNLSDCFVRQGETVKKGEFIGQINKDNDLSVFVMKEGVFVRPEEVLGCKVVHTYGR